MKRLAKLFEIIARNAMAGMFSCVRNDWKGVCNALSEIDYYLQIAIKHYERGRK